MHAKKFGCKGSNTSRDTTKKQGRGKLNGVQKTSKFHRRAAADELSGQRMKERETLMIWN